ncbi:acyl-CoA dehydrogenase family protein [Pseudonocardia acaciae]|uniref:acyl-CoA dehydrogenase family protein n=1 Tax=Pseudonocardia acaciae TaxID=551276 RepID=UPI00048D9051|nr:acyl-CoA dehydrogenase family protein [Pseudonocardia acaciae]
MPFEEVASWFSDRAGPLDRGECDVRDGIRWLGERDLIAPPGGGLGYRVRLVERIAGECLSSAFSLWAHLMVIEYLNDGDGPRDELRAGRVVGATAMAPALRDVAGLEPVPVLATRTPTGLRLSGPIRWASNLFPDAVVVLPVRLDTGGRAVVRIRASDPGTTVARRPELLALNGTASSSVRLEDVSVPADAVLSEDLPGFVGRVRPAFLLIQSAFCVGLALRSVREAAEHATGPNAGPNAELAEDVRAAARRADEVCRRLHDAAEAPVSLGSLGTADLLRLRLDAASVATTATRLEATVRGGAGYLARSEVGRRLREGAFLPIQAPTEGQLRWELSRCA